MMPIQFSHIQFSKEVKNKKIHHLSTLKSAHISTDFIQCPGPGDSLRTRTTSQLLKHAVSKGRS